MRHNIRANEEEFCQNDKVFYKRDDCNRWRGPGKVVGQDGKVLFIRHGSQLVRVATCRALKVEKSKEKQEIERNPIRNEDQTENKILIEESSDDEEKKAKDLQNRSNVLKTHVFYC